MESSKANVRMNINFGFIEEVFTSVYWSIIVVGLLLMYDPRLLSFHLDTILYGMAIFFVVGTLVSGTLSSVLIHSLIKNVKEKYFDGELTSQDRQVIQVLVVNRAKMGNALYYMSIPIFFAIVFPAIMPVYVGVMFVALHILFAYYGGQLRKSYILIHPKEE